MKKRTLALVLSVALLLPLFACGDSEAGSESKTPNEPSAAAENTTEPTLEQKKKKPTRSPIRT